MKNELRIIKSDQIPMKFDNSLILHDSIQYERILSEVIPKREIFNYDNDL